MVILRFEPPPPAWQASTLSIALCPSGKFKHERNSHQNSFQTLFRASYLNDKHPVIFMKDVDFDNLKSLVEYMYKGEANVAQHMLQSFIRWSFKWSLVSVTRLWPFVRNTSMHYSSVNFSNLTASKDFINLNILINKICSSYSLADLPTNGALN